MSLEVMLAVLLAALLHATWNALIKSGADKLLDAVTLCMAAGLLAAVALPFLPPPARASWPYLAASVVIHVAYFSLVALAYRAADMSFIYPLMRGTAPLFTALLVLAFVGETLSAGGWFGVVVLCLGVVLLAADGRCASNLPARAWGFGLANAVVIVAYTVIDGTGVRAAGDAWSYVLWLFALTAPGMFVVGLVLRGRALMVVPAASWRKGLLGGACSIAAYGIALWAMTQAPIALVAALRETSVLFGTAIATLLLHEKFGPARWLAAGLMVAGAAVMKMA